jgi:hypothetical protein
MNARVQNVQWSVRGLSLLLLLLSGALSPVWAQTESPCPQAIASKSTENQAVLIVTPSPELREWVASTLKKQPFYRRLFHYSMLRTSRRLAKVIAKTCPEAEQCDYKKVRAATQRILDRDWWNFTTLPGKAAVCTVHVGSIIGMSAGAAWLSDYLGLPKPVSTGIGAGAGLITNSVFGEWGEFWMIWVKGVNRQLAAKWWKPRPDDVWGNDRKYFNDQNNLKNNKTMNADILLVPQLVEAKKAMLEHDEPQALEIFSTIANSLHENLRGIHSEAEEISRYVDTYFVHRIQVPEGFGRRALHATMHAEKVAADALADANRYRYLRSLFRTWFPKDFAG